MQAEHDKKIPAYSGNIGRFDGGQVKSTLEHLLESNCKREGEFDKNEDMEEV